MPKPHLLLVTGKLAEPALRRLLADLAGRAGFDFSVAVLPITVVALATTPWVARHLSVPPGIDRVLLPGLCGATLEAEQLGHFERIVDLAQQSLARAQHPHRFVEVAERDQQVAQVPEHTAFEAAVPDFAVDSIAGRRRSDRGVVFSASTFVA